MVKCEKKRRALWKGKAGGGKRGRSTTLLGLSYVQSNKKKVRKGNLHSVSTMLNYWNFTRMQRVAPTKVSRGKRSALRVQNAFLQETATRVIEGAHGSKIFFYFYCRGSGLAKGDTCAGWKRMLRISTIQQMLHDAKSFRTSSAMFQHSNMH